MEYRLDVSDEADRNADEGYLYIARDSPNHAAKWYSGLLAAVASLTQNPERCALAPEAEFFGREIRQLLYGKRRGKYRILFEIVGSTVHILHIRHAARDFLKPG